MNVVGIIPARYASTRFPGKPLAIIQSKPMIQHVYERAVQSGLFKKVIVATDNERIVETVENFGGEVMMTSSQHQSGTDRCGEVVKKLKTQFQPFDVVVNIQGDEPFINTTQLALVIDAFKDSNTHIASLQKKISQKEELFSANVVKVIEDCHQNAIYFSRHPIPFCRGIEEEKWLEKSDFYKHIGVYAYRYDILEQLTKLPQSSLELCESLEQLRWIENGYKIKLAKTEHENIAIDTPEDLQKIETI